MGNQEILRGAKSLGDGGVPELGIMWVELPRWNWEPKITECNFTRFCFVLMSQGFLVNLLQFCSFDGHWSLGLLTTNSPTYV